MTDEPTDGSKIEPGSEKGQPDRSAAERVGRALGKALRRVKRTKVWQQTSQAYHEGMEEGKKEQK